MEGYVAFELCGREGGDKVHGDGQMVRDVEVETGELVESETG